MSYDRLLLQPLEFFFFFFFCTDEVGEETEEKQFQIKELFIYDVQNVIYFFPCAASYTV